MLIGSLTSAVPVVVALVIAGDQKDNIIATAFLAGYFGILGAFTALIFWLVARPDKRPVGMKAQTSN